TAENIRYEEATRKRVEDQRAALKAVENTTAKTADLLGKFGNIQKAIDEEHEKRLLKTAGTITARLANANDDPRLTGLKEIAEERMALLNSPKKDPVQDAVERGNKI